jgi:putative inorganic carbon (HCO3(-)) transporter
VSPLTRQYPGTSTRPVVAAAPTSPSGNSRGAEDLYSLNLKALWAAFRAESFSFWMICAYLFIEYVRPQSIIPSLDVVPWAKVFLVLAVLGLPADPNRKWVHDWANLWMTLFLATILLSSSLAVYPDISWSHWFDFLGWYLIYFLIINIVTSERRFIIFVLIFLVASFKLSLFGARTWAMRGFAFTNWGLAGPPGFFQNSGELSIQMLMFAPLALQLARFVKSRVTRLKYWVLLSFPLTAAMTVIGASSRGGQLGLVYQFYRSLLKGRLSLRTLIIVATLAGLGWAALPEQQKARFSAAGTDDTSQQRLLYWRHGLEMIEKYPVLGVGFYNFPHYYEIHYPQDMLFGAAQLPHNIFIQVGTDTGVLGLAFFSLILYRNFRCAREIQARAGPGEDFAASMAKGLNIAMWGFVIAGQFVTVTYYPFPWINLALTVALGNIVRRNPTPVTVPAVSG